MCQNNEEKRYYYLYFHVDQCINFNQTQFVTETLIAKASLKSLYSRLGFKVIRDFATSPNFEKACNQFNYEAGKSIALQKKTIGLQYYLTIPWRVTIIYGNWIELNDKKYVLKKFKEVPLSDDWFPYEYIDAEVKKKLDKTKGNIAGDEMEKETEHYVESLNHNIN